MLAFANSVFIAAKHVDFSAEEPRHPSRDPDGYLLAGQDEVDNSKANDEHMLAHDEHMLVHACTCLHMISTFQLKKIFL